MKALSIIFYALGFILLIISCFTQSIPVTWWLGGCAVVALIVGCIFQFNANTQAQQYRYHHRHE